MIRHTKSTRCPVCQGAGADPRGKGERCFGFTSDDGEWARCTREDAAGGLPLEPETSAYVHKLHGPCNCGAEHAPASNGNTSKIILATYEYRNEQDEPLYRVLRYLPKTFSQQRWDKKKNDWVSGEGVMSGVRRVPYRLPEILTSTGPVLIVEGEKDADNAWALGVPATCNVGGAGKWKDDYSLFLVGRECFVIPDKDEKGEEHALSVRKSLEETGVKSKILRLPEKDLTKWLEEGGTKEKLVAMIEKKLDWRKALHAEPIKATELAPFIDEPIPFVVEPILIRGCLTQIQGAPKGGKSSFAVYLSLCAATGTWPYPERLRCEKKDPRILYITWEDPKLMMAKKLSLYAAGLGFERTFLPENLTFLFGPDIFIDKQDHATALVAAIKELQADIVFIDTLSFVHLCNENEASEMKIPMRNLGELAIETHTAICYVHHASKGGGTNGKSAVDKSRGSSAIAAAWHVLIDWGVREEGSSINPVKIESKYGHEHFFWDVNYAVEKDQDEKVVGVRWEIAIQGQQEGQAIAEKMSKGDRTKRKIMETLTRIFPTYPEGPTAKEVQEHCGLPIDLKTIKRHLNDEVEAKRLECKVGKRGTFHYIPPFGGI